MAVDVLVERFDVRVLGIEAAIDGGPGPGDIGGTGCTRQSQQGREGETAPRERFRRAHVLFPLISPRGPISGQGAAKHGH